MSQPQHYQCGTTLTENDLEVFDLGFLNQFLLLLLIAHRMPNKGDKQSKGTGRCLDPEYSVTSTAYIKSN